MSTNGALTRLTSISARRAVNFGSQMSTCDRMCRMPCETCHSIALVARRTTSSSVSSAFLSDQHSIPSNSVPLSFHLGSPAVSVVSRWTCDSTNGAVTKHPAASMVSEASAGNPGWMSTNRPSRTPMSLSSPFAESLALWTIRSSIAFSFRPQPSCQYLRPCAALGHGQGVQSKLPTEDLQDSCSAESSLASSHARPGAELQPVYCACAHRTVDGSHDISFSHCLATTHDATISGILRDHTLLLFWRTFAKQWNARVDRDERRITSCAESRTLQKQDQLFSDGRGCRQARGLDTCRVEEPGSSLFDKEVIMSHDDRTGSCELSDQLSRVEARNALSSSSQYTSQSVCGGCQVILVLDVVRSRTGYDVTIRRPADNDSLAHGRRDLKHRVLNVIVRTVLQQEILTQPGTNMKVPCPGHPTDIVREQAGCINHESGLQDTFAGIHAPPTGNSLQRTDRVFEQEVDAIQGCVLRKSQCEFIGFDRASGCREESAIRFGNQVRLQLHELAAFEDAQSWYTIRASSCKQLFEMSPLRRGECHDERAVTFHMHPKVFGQLIVHGVSTHVQPGHQRPRYRVIPCMDDTRVGLGGPALACLGGSLTYRYVQAVSGQLARGRATNDPGPDDHHIQHLSSGWQISHLPMLLLWQRLCASGRTGGPCPPASGPAHRIDQPRTGYAIPAGPSTRP